MSQLAPKNIKTKLAKLAKRAEIAPHPNTTPPLFREEDSSVYGRLDRADRGVRNAIEQSSGVRSAAAAAQHLTRPRKITPIFFFLPPLFRLLERGRERFLRSVPDKSFARVIGHRSHRIEASHPSPPLRHLEPELKREGEPCESSRVDRVKEAVICAAKATSQTCICTLVY